MGDGGGGGAVSWPYLYNTCFQNHVNKAVRSGGMEGGRGGQFHGHTYIILVFSIMPTRR